jgi:hypothetical protein
MATPLRILVAGGGYHVTSRGNRREAIYRTDADRWRFLGLVAEAVRLAGGMKYGAAAQAVRRFAARLAKDAAKVWFVENMRRRLGQDREEKHP